MNYKETAKRDGNENKELQKAAPEIMNAFSNLHGEYSKESALSMVTKECVALGISIAIRCEPCILAHVQTFIEVGGTREELVDVIKTAVLMGGGPGTAYGQKALAAFDEFSKE